MQVEKKYNSTPDWAPIVVKLLLQGDKDINRYDVFMMNPDGKARDV